MPPPPKRPRVTKGFVRPKIKPPPRQQTPKPAPKPGKATTPPPHAATPSLGAAAPAVAAFTDEILAIMRRAGHDDAHARVEVGNVLMEARAQLPHGAWLGWLDGDDLPLEPRSAQNYIGLARWATQRPAIFDKIAPLGAKKLYRLIRVPDHQLAALLAQDAAGKLSLQRMKYEQLGATLRALAGKPPPPQAVVAMRTALRSARALVKALDALLPHASSLPSTELDELHDLIAAALAGFKAQFDVDD